MRVYSCTCVVLVDFHLLSLDGVKVLTGVALGLIPSGLAQRMEPSTEGPSLISDWWILGSASLILSFKLFSAVKADHNLREVTDFSNGVTGMFYNNVSV